MSTMFTKNHSMTMDVQLLNWPIQNQEAVLQKVV